MISNFLYVCIELLHTIVFAIIYSCRTDFVANFTFVIHHFDFNYTLFCLFSSPKSERLKDISPIRPSYHPSILPLTHSPLSLSFGHDSPSSVVTNPSNSQGSEISIPSPDLIPSALLAAPVSCHVTQNSVCATQVCS